MKTFLLLLMVALLFAEPLFSQNTLDNAGLTASTPSAVAFSLRKLSSSYSGPVLKVRRSSDNAEANLSFDGSGTVSASSLVTFTPGVTVGLSFGTVQTGIISSSVPKTGTITIKAVKTGTITTSNGSLTVTGSGTTFTAEIVAGDRLFNATNNVFLGVVASVSNNTKLTLTNYATVSLGSISYKTTNAVVTGTGTNFTGELVVGDRLFSTTNAYLGTVAGVTNSTLLTLNGADAVTVTAINYKSTSAIITGTGTSFNSLSPGDMLISNNTTLGIISSITNSTTLVLTTKAGGSVSNLAFKTTTGTISFSTFYASTSAYVNTWYDQSGNNRDVIQIKPSNQPRIVNSDVLYTVNGKTSMEFSNTLAAFLQTSAAASYLNNTLYTMNKVTAEATINPNLQLPISTTGGNGPSNSISHYGYRSSSQFTVAQYDNDQNFSATPSTSLEQHTSVKISAASSQFYKNGISLGIQTSGAPSNLMNVGLLNIGYYTPTNSYYNGSVSELLVFSSALNNTNLTLLNDNQLAFYNIATTYWTGAVSSDWANTGNWSTGIVPTISSPSIVVIPAGKPRYPIISGVSPANSISLEAGTSLTIGGTLQLAGTISNFGTCTASGGTIQYTGTAPQGITANTFFGNVVQNMIINNTTGVTMNGTVAVMGNLTFTAGKLSIANASFLIGGTVTNTVAGGLTGGLNSSLVINGTVSPTLSFDQTTPGTTNLLKNLTINSAGQLVTLANNLVLNGTGTTTFTAGKLAIGSNTLSIRGAIINTVNEGLKGSASGNVIVDGTASPTLSFDQTIPGSTNALSSLTISNSGQTVTLNRPLAILSALNLTAGTFWDGGNQLTSTGIINISAGTFKLGSSTVATVWPAFSTNAISPGGTVEYAAGVAQIVSSAPVYQNLTISSTGGTTAANNLTVNGILNLSVANPSPVAGSLSMASYTLNMGGSATTIGQGDVTGIVKRSTILPNVIYTMGNEFTSITFPNTGTLPSQMSIRINMGTVPSWKSGAVKRTYDFIQTGGSGTKAVIEAHYLDAELNGNIETKLVDFSYRYTGAVTTEHGKSNFNTTQNWVALSNVNVAFFSSIFGNLELSFDESALTTLTWNGSASTSWITAANWTPNGGPSTNTILIIPDAGTTPNDPSLPALASNGSITIETGGILNADPGAQLSLNNAGLAWSNSGTFNAATSTVTFTDPNATINGITNFNNIVIGSGAAVLMTTGTVMRIGGTIINNGTWSTGLLHNTVEYNGNNQTIISPNGSTQSYHNLVISGSGTSVLPPTLNIKDNLTINGLILASGNTIIMNGDEPEQVIGGSSQVTLNNLIINNSSGTVRLDQDVTVANSLTLAGGKLFIDSNTLTLSGDVINSIPNGITGSTGSNLVINGTARPVLSFDQAIPGVSDILNNLTINSDGQGPLLASDLKVDGTTTFTAGKLAINGNTLTINGPIINTVNGGLTGGNTSNLIVSGGMVSPALSFDQTVPGITNLLNNVSVNNAGQSTFLMGPLVVNGSLNLESGLIITTAANSLSLTTTATFTGGSNASYVDGPLVRNTAGIADFIFPVGKSNTYRPVTVTPFVGAAGMYSSEYFPALPPSGTFDMSLVGIATNEYWDVSKLSGPDAQVTLTYTGNNSWSNGSPTNGTSIFVAQLNNSEWGPVYGNALAGNIGNGARAVFSKTLSPYSSFTFGYGPIVALPVTLIDFGATRVGQAVNLFWKTVNEFNFSDFELERSTDGHNFYKIGSVPATNTSSVKNYNWIDHRPIDGVSYYRLKMVDIDARFKYSNIVRFTTEERRSISIYPNPVVGYNIQLQLHDQIKGDYSISLYTINGQRIMTTQIVHDGNDIVRGIAINRNLTGGVYYLEISGPEKIKKTCKIVIQ